MAAIYPLGDNHTEYTTSGCRTDIVYISVNDTSMRTGEEPGYVVYYIEPDPPKFLPEPKSNAAHSFPEAWPGIQNVVYFGLLVVISLWFMLSRLIRAPPENEDGMEMFDNRCSYCGKELGDKHTFSYGVPGIRRTFGCDRAWCKFRRKVNRRIKRAIAPIVKKLYAWVNSST